MVTAAGHFALIPARGGSKRIPGKNWRDFCGKPMIVWSIEAALQSGLFERVLVSTDDDRIAEIASAAGAEIPFRRPAHLADDFTSTRDVINHAIGELEGGGETVRQLCCIYATAPFVRPETLTEAAAILRSDSEIDFVFAAATYPYPVQRALVRSPSGGVIMLNPEFSASRSQDLPEAFHDAGQFYWGRGEAFVAGNPMFGDRSRPYLIDRLAAQDIDTPEDWAVAEALFKVQIS